MENEEFQKLILESFKKIDENFKDIKNKLREHDQHFIDLKTLAKQHHEELEKVAIKVEELNLGQVAIKKDLSTIELVTANNWGDIARLKSAK
ncbi:MAG: hypothetical protein P4M12_05975 [Gammaproteobacteria bacterium]|nr:hypothetical protein [Gammaproteobacteria bacterium]MDR3587432.1 hypothetical protein [Desulfosporosinus sp.]